MKESIKTPKKGGKDKSHRSDASSTRRQAQQGSRKDVVQAAMKDRQAGSLAATQPQGG